MRLQPYLDPGAMQALLVCNLKALSAPVFSIPLSSLMLAQVGLQGVVGFFWGEMTSGLRSRQKHRMTGEDRSGKEPGRYIKFSVRKE